MKGVVGVLMRQSMESLRYVMGKIQKVKQNKTNFKTNIIE